MAKNDFTICQKHISRLYVQNDILIMSIYLW